MRRGLPLALVVGLASLWSPLAGAVPFFFSTNAPDGKMAMASRPGVGGKIEIEAADDFLLSSETVINKATFTGLIVPNSLRMPTIGEVRVEIYRVFPADSTSPPSGHVPTRNNSPADVAFADRDSAASNLTFLTTDVSTSFIASNSVLNGIDPIPNQATGGEGLVTGREVQFSVTFTTPFDLPADHYFFVPQVQVTSGEFYWLSAPRPIVAPGTPFSPDLQTWIRDANLEPDWLRVGTDIVDSTTPPTFNAVFTLEGEVREAVVTGIPEPATAGLGVLVLSALGAGAMRRRHS